MADTELKSICLPKGLQIMSKKRAPRIEAQYEAKSKYYGPSSYPKGWTYKSDPGVIHNNKQCRTCIYRSNESAGAEPLTRVGCDYLLIKGHSRGCHPSPTCTKYVKGKRLKMKQTFNPHHQAGFSNTIDEPPFARLKRFTK